MAATMTPGGRRSMNELSDYASRTWGVYLFSGIVSIIFGVFVLTLEIDWIAGSSRGVTASYLVALLIGAWLIGWGILQVLGALGDRRPNSGWYVVGGIVSIGAGVLAWAWPDATYTVLVVIVGWALILWGIGDITAAFMLHGAKSSWRKEQRAAVG